MPIEFRCSQCGQLLKVPDSAAGKNARCPKCQSLMTVPGIATALPFSTALAPSASSGDRPAPGHGEYALAPATQPALAPASQPVLAPATPPLEGPSTPPTNPFAGDQPGTAIPSASPELKPPAGNPFAPVDSLNPYASPGPAAYAYGTQLFGAGERPGLPWEIQGHNFAAWWETTKLCMFQPTYAFSIMRQYGGLGPPMLFCALGLVIGSVGKLVWNIPLVVGMTLLGNPRGQDAAVLVGTQIGLQVFGTIVGVAIGATLGLLIGSAVIHVCLMMLGGARQGYETTLRTLAFAQGATAWLNIVPCAGGIVLFAWFIVLEIVGLARAHETTAGKTALAVFLPIIALGVCAAIFVALALGITFSGRR